MTRRAVEELWCQLSSTLWPGLCKRWMRRMSIVETASKVLIWPISVVSGQRRTHRVASIRSSAVMMDTIGKGGCLIPVGTSVRGMISRSAKVPLERKLLQKLHCLFLSYWRWTSIQPDRLIDTGWHTLARERWASPVAGEMTL